MRKIALIVFALFLGIISAKAQCEVSISGAESVCMGNPITLLAVIERGTVTCSSTVNMCNGNTVVQCGQMICFEDDNAGSNGYYGNNANFTHTFTSSNGGPLKIEFGQARLQTSGDSLKLYDGTPATGTLLNPGATSGQAFSQQTYIATTGTLTAVFISNASWNYEGWTANLTCEACGELTYLWSTGDTTPSIRIQPNATTTYTCTVNSTEPGCCSGTAQHTLEVIDCGVSGCPHILPADDNGDNTIHLNCATGLQTTLYANAVVTAMSSDNYTVQRIPFNPPFSFTSGTRIFANATDDIWGPTQTLPFTFCYFGNTYTRIVPGANAVASFNNHSDGSSCAWSFSSSLPSTNLFANTIFACYRDIEPASDDFNPANGDGGIYQGVLGEYPCRAYKLSFNNIKLFSCNEIRTFSTMIVLYEGTNIIDIYLRHAPTCASWNNGNGVVGIQNAAQSVAVVPPGRNTGPWTAQNEAWRFIPTGSATYTITWYEGIDTSAATGIVVGYGEQIDVEPTESTTYTARLQYTACSGDHFDLINQCHVVVNNDAADVVVSASKDTLCPGEPVTLFATAEGAVAYEWDNGMQGDTITTTPTQEHQTYEVTVTFENGCTNTAQIEVHAVDTIAPPVFDEVAMICSGNPATLTVNEHATYQWSNGATTQSITVAPTATTTYECTVSNEAGCVSSATVTVVVDVSPVASFIPENYLTYLENGVAVVNFIDLSQNASHWEWDFGVPNDPNATSTLQQPSYTYTTSGLYTVTQWVRSELGCSDSTTRKVSIQKPYNFYIPTAFSPNGDGVNDVFLPQGEGVNESDYLLQIFDRNGRLLFQSKSLYQGWDGTSNGKQLPFGTYVYVIRTSTMDAVPKEYTGTITIVQ